MPRLHFNRVLLCHGCNYIGLMHWPSPWLRLLIFSTCYPFPAPHRALLVVAEQNGNHLHECWTEVLRCVSRFELLQQLTAGVPTDALLFAMPTEKSSGAGGAASKLKQRLLRGRGAKGGEGEDAFAHDSFSSINDMGLHAGAPAAAGHCRAYWGYNRGREKASPGGAGCSWWACLHSSSHPQADRCTCTLPSTHFLQAGGRWTASCCHRRR